MKSRFEMVKARHAESFEKAVKDGKADHRMIGLCRFVAATKKFFTSSCCAGRILLLQLPKGESKREASFHRRWHREVKFRELKRALLEKTKGELWFKMEPFILHIGTNDIENAGRLLKIMNKAGIKRGGIIVVKPGKFLVELQGTQEISLPLKRNSEILVEDEYLRFLLRKANSKLRQTYERLERFEKMCRAELK